MRLPFSAEQNAYLGSPEFTFAGYEARWPGERSPEAIARQRRRVLAADPPGQQTRPMTAPGGGVVGTFTVAEPRSEEAMLARLRAMQERFLARRSDSPTQQFTEWTPAGNLPVGLVFTGDWHVGAGGVDTIALERDLRRIAAVDGLYAVGMGDFVEGVGTRNKAAPALYEGDENDGDEQEALALFLAQMVPSWVAFMEGNHDAWLRAGAGLSRVPRVFKPLGCPIFHQGGGTIFSNVGSERYVVVVSHRGIGRGAGSALNTTNAQRRVFDSWPTWENADVICLGHYHFNDQQVVDRKGRPVHYLRSGTYKTVDPYAAEMGFVPAIGTPLVILYPDRHKVRSFRGDEFEHGVEELARAREQYRKEVA